MGWLLVGLLQGYRVVDSGSEVDITQATERVKDTLARYRRGRRARVLIRDKTWCVMVRGWSPKKEDT